MPLYEFVCFDCGAIHEKVMKYEERPDLITCEFCSGGKAEYRVGKPAMFRVKFDQNGRIGYKYSLGNGKHTYKSATREKYEHNIGSKTGKDLKSMGTDKNKSIYTREYGNKVEKKERATLDHLKKVLKETGN